MRAPIEEMLKIAPAFRARMPGQDCLDHAHRAEEVRVEQLLDVAVVAPPRRRRGTRSRRCSPARPRRRNAPRPAATASATWAESVTSSGRTSAVSGWAAAMSSHRGGVPGGDDGVVPGVEHGLGQGAAKSGGASGDEPRCHGVSFRSVCRDGGIRLRGWASQTGPGVLRPGPARRARRCRERRSRPARRGLSSKSKTSMFSAMRLGLVDLGMTERPVLQAPAQHHLGGASCRGPARSAPITGSSRVLVCSPVAVEGDAADRRPGLGEDPAARHRMPGPPAGRSRGAARSGSRPEPPGVSVSSWSRWSTMKLLTPMARTLPSASRVSRAR